VAEKGSILIWTTFSRATVRLLTADEEKIFVDTIPIWSPFTEIRKVLRQLKKKIQPQNYNK
jgi:hypothetical protein